MQLQLGQIQMQQTQIQLSKLNLEQQLKLWSARPENLDTDLFANWTDWSTFVMRPNPLFMTSGLILKLDKSLSSTAPTYETLSMTNALRTAGRLLMRGYGEGSGDFGSFTLTQDELRTFGRDFEDILAALKLQAVGSTSLMDRIYTDSRFFTLSGDGRNLVNNVLLVEELANLLSGGVISIQRLQSLLKANHCNIDADGFYDQACFFTVFENNIPNIFPGLADLSDQVQTGALNLKEIEPVLTSIGLGQPHKDGSITISEMTNICVVIHYLETLMAIYDTNHDQLLGVSEIKSAFPRFASEIRLLSPLPADFDKNAFLYVAYNGEVPQTETLLDTLGTVFDFGFFLGQQRIRVLPKLTRSDLLKVISLLKQQTSNSPSSSQFEGQVTPQSQ